MAPCDFPEGVGTPCHPNPPLNLSANKTFACQLSSENRMHCGKTNRTSLNDSSPHFQRCAGPRGWGTLIFSYIRRLGSFFGVQNFEFHYRFYENHVSIRVNKIETKVCL